MLTCNSGNVSAISQAAVLGSAIARPAVVRNASPFAGGVGVPFRRVGGAGTRQAGLYFTSSKLKVRCNPTNVLRWLFKDAWCCGCSGRLFGA